MTSLNPAPLNTPVSPASSLDAQVGLALPAHLGARPLDGWCLRASAEQARNQTRPWTTHLYLELFQGGREADWRLLSADEARTLAGQLRTLRDQASALEEGHSTELDLASEGMRAQGIIAERWCILRRPGGTFLAEVFTESSALAYDRLYGLSLAEDDPDWVLTEPPVGRYDLSLAQLLALADDLDEAAAALDRATGVLAGVLERALSHLRPWHAALSAGHPGGTSTPEPGLAVWARPLTTWTGDFAAEDAEDAEFELGVALDAQQWQRIQAALARPQPRHPWALEGGPGQNSVSGAEAQRQAALAAQGVRATMWLAPPVTPPQAVRAHTTLESVTRGLDRLTTTPDLQALGVDLQGTRAMPLEVEAWTLLTA